MGFLGFWGSVLRGKSGRRRDADGRFCREIPGFLSGARARRGDSAHGGHRRALGAKKFLKIFKKGVENREIGVREVLEDGLGAPYIGCTGRFLGLEARPLAALLESVTRGALRAGTSAISTRLKFLRFTPLIYRGPVCKLHRSPHRGHLCLSDMYFLNLHLWIEATRLPYAGYDYILSK